MHIAVVQEIHRVLQPSLHKLHTALDITVQEFEGTIKIGRTHTQDTTPLTLGEELSGSQEQIALSIACVEAVLLNLHKLAIGGTSVGTGLNTPKDCDAEIANCIAEEPGPSFITAPNKFEALAARGRRGTTLIETSNTIDTIACSLIKIVNGIHLLHSGPISGLGEPTLPANEPGLSIMPNKVNPTQCEVLTTVCALVMDQMVVCLCDSSPSPARIACSADWPMTAPSRMTTNMRLPA